MQLGLAKYPQCLLKAIEQMCKRLQGYRRARAKDMLSSLNTYCTHLNDQQAGRGFTWHMLDDTEVEFKVLASPPTSSL